MSPRDSLNTCSACAQSQNPRGQFYRGIEKLFPHHRRIRALWTRTTEPVRRPPQHDSTSFFTRKKRTYPSRSKTRIKINPHVFVVFPFLCQSKKAKTQKWQQCNASAIETNPLPFCKIRSENSFPFLFLVSISITKEKGKK